jgi:hypothetical protein
MLLRRVVLAPHYRYSLNPLPCMQLAIQCLPINSYSCSGRGTYLASKNSYTASGDVNIFVPVRLVTIIWYPYTRIKPKPGKRPLPIKRAFHLVLRGTGSFHSCSMPSISPHRARNAFFSSFVIHYVYSNAGTVSTSIWWTVRDSNPYSK